MGRDLLQLLFLIRGQIRLDVLGIAPNQVNASGNNDVQVDDPGAAALPFAPRRPSQFPNSARSRYHVASIRMVNQINSNRLNPTAPISSVASALNFGSCRTAISGATFAIQEYTAVRYSYLYRRIDAGVCSAAGLREGRAAEMLS
jgi:hypothetical protein